MNTSHRQVEGNRGVRASHDPDDAWRRLRAIAQKKEWSTTTIDGTSVSLAEQYVHILEDLARPRRRVIAQAEVGRSAKLASCQRAHRANHQVYILLSHFSEVPTQILQVPQLQIGYRSWVRSTGQVINVMKYLGRVLLQLIQ